MLINENWIGIDPLVCVFRWPHCIGLCY